MTPSPLLDWLVKNNPGVPCVDLSGARPSIDQWRSSRPLSPDPICLPYAKMIFGFKCAGFIDRSNLEPFEAAGKKPQGYGFLLSKWFDSEIVGADPYFVSHESRDDFGNFSNGGCLVSPSGQIYPREPIADPTKWRAMVADYLEPVLTVLVMLASGEFRLVDAPLTDLSRKLRKLRAKTGDPKSYKILKVGKSPILNGENELKAF